MRASLLGFLVSAAIVSATGSLCVNDDFEDLVSKTSCGCSRKLTQCLSTGVDLTRSDLVENCFTTSGCTEADAVIGASWFMQKCQGAEDSEFEDELRRRQDGSETTSAKKGSKTTAAAQSSSEDTADSESTTEKADKTTKKSEGKTTAAAESTTAPSTAEASTTSAAATSAAATSSTEDSSTASSAPTSTTSDSTTTSATAASETTGSTTTSLVCSTTNMVTTTACSVSKGKTITCSPTIYPSATCAPGIICQKDNQGKDICMKRDNHLTTSGIVVSIVFAVGILIAVAAILVTQYQSRAAQRRREREAERTALLGGASYAKNSKGRAAADVETAKQQPYRQRGGNPSEAHVPLIPQGQTTYQTQQHYQTAPDYFSAAGNSNSVSPNANANEPRAAPKLHPGLGALRQT